jgi:hypothetical protein
MKPRSPKRRVRVHAHPNRSTKRTAKKPPRPEAHGLGAPPISSEKPPDLQESALRILAEIVAGLERARDSHKSDLDGQIARLRQLLEVAVKAAEITSQSTVPKSKGPRTFGGFMLA